MAKLSKKEAEACPECGCPKDYHRSGFKGACVMADAGGGNCGCTYYFKMKQEIVHIAPDRAAPALCGAVKGRATWSPDEAILVIDRYCVRCHKKWEKANGLSGR